MGQYVCPGTGTNGPTSFGINYTKLNYILMQFVLNVNGILLSGLTYSIRERQFTIQKREFASGRDQKWDRVLIVRRFYGDWKQATVAENS